MKEIRKLIAIGACTDAISWLEKQETYEQAWRDCPRGDWMLWYIYKTLDGSDSEFRKFTLAKSRCANTVLHLMNDERSRNAVLVSEKFGLGEATIEELRIAADAAYAAAYAADAAYAAASAAYAAYAAASAASAASATYAAAARKQNQNKCADIIRELYPDAPIL